MARGAVIAGVLALAAGVGGLVVLRKFALGDVQAVAASLPAEIEAAKKEGLPLEIEDLKLPVASDANNAATDYQKAIDMYEKMAPTDRAKLLDEMNAAIRGSYRATAQIHRFLPIRTLLVQGARKPHSDFKHNWKEGYMVLLPEYAQLKALVKLLSAEAVLEARAGRMTDCLESLRAARDVSKHSGVDPILISLLVRVTNESVVIRAGEIIASEKASDGRILEELNQWVRGFEPRPNYMFYLRGEVVTGRYSLHALKSEQELSMLASGNLLDSEPPPGKPLNRELRNAYEARYLSHWRKLFSLMNSSEKKDAATLGRIIDDATLEVEPKWDKDPTARYVRVVLPVFAQAGVAVNVADARIELLQAKLALLQYKRAHGSFPQSLNELKKSYIDPMSGKPLGYKETPAGFIVYSVGRDGKDDGGLEDRGQGKPDVTMEHPLNPAKLPRDLSYVR